MQPAGGPNSSAWHKGRELFGHEFNSFVDLGNFSCRLSVHTPLALPHTACSTNGARHAYPPHHHDERQAAEPPRDAASGAGWSGGAGSRQRRPRLPARAVADPPDRNPRPRSRRKPRAGRRLAACAGSSPQRRNRGPAPRAEPSPACRHPRGPGGTLPCFSAGRVRALSVRPILRGPGDAPAWPPPSRRSTVPRARPACPPAPLYARKSRSARASALAMRSAAMSTVSLVQMSGGDRIIVSPTARNIISLAIA